MPQIRILPTHLVNKIAAGEVIDRPASIVKELIENALDAGAARIDVAVEDGGRKLIAVTDDGSGMSAEDLALAFAPHATSKIAAEDDLYRIETMGFRGEALASIASVSHAHIRTARKPETAGPGTEPTTVTRYPVSGPTAIGGHEVEASGETIGTVRPCAAAPGATVTVRDLFFNTPARRKFLRSANTELGHITEQLARLALPYPHVAFRLTHNGREIQDLPPAGSTIQRAEDLFGQELADGLLTIHPRAGPVQISGFISSPAAARATGKWQYFFLNGRYIRDRLLSHALRDAYRGLMDQARWPVAMLFLQVDPAEVDVNVHPTKIEVRFHNSQAVHGQLLAALRDTLNRANLTPDASLDDLGAPGAARPEEALQRREGDDSQTEDRRQSLREALADFFRSVPPPQPRFSFPESTSYRRPAEDGQSVGAAPPPLYPSYTPAKPPPLSEAPEAQSEAHGERAAHAGAFATPSGTRPVPRASDEEPTPPAPVLPPTAIQIHSAYIVTSCEDGLLIVDQHALHERLIYNDLKRRLTEGPLTGQRLLMPEVLTVTPAEGDALQRRADLLWRMGIEVAPFGPSSVALQQFPTLLAERGAAGRDFLREVLDKLAEDETTDSERLLENLLETLACKAAVKAGDPLTPAEMDALLARREEAEKGSACPHGRPTTLRLSLRDLDRQFKRT